MYFFVYYCSDQWPLRTFRARCDKDISKAHKETSHDKEYCAFMCSFISYHQNDSCIVVVTVRVAILVLKSFLRQTIILELKLNDLSRKRSVFRRQKASETMGQQPPSLSLSSLSPSLYPSRTILCSPETG